MRIDLHHIGKGKPLRFRFKKGLIRHKGKLKRIRYGFRGNKLVELKFFKK